MKGEGIRNEIRVIKLRKPIVSKYIKAECDNFIFKTRVLMLHPIQLSGEGEREGVRHEICVITVRKATASEYVKAECDNFIFKAREF